MQQVNRYYRYFYSRKTVQPTSKNTEGKSTQRKILVWKYPPFLNRPCSLSYLCVMRNTSSDFLFLGVTASILSQMQSNSVWHGVAEKERPSLLWGNRMSTHNHSFSTLYDIFLFFLFFLCVKIAEVQLTRVVCTN